MVVNETIRSILNRRSCRSFTGEPLDEETLRTIVEAGTYAPNSGDFQPWLFAVVTSPALLERFNRNMLEVWKSWGHFDEDYSAPIDMPNISTIYNAPCIVFFLEHKQHTPVVSTAFAAENMMIAAESLGVGSCWVQSLAAEVFHGAEGFKLRHRLSGPDYDMVGALLLGYPTADAFKKPKSPRRKNLIRYMK